jgi:zinc transporter, ZIP family
MTLLSELSIVFAVGLVTGLATGLGVLPFFLVEEFRGRWLVGLWGVAVGILLSATTFGLLAEGLETGEPGRLALGVFAGIVFVFLADRAVDGYEFAPGTTDVDPQTVVLTVAVLTIHSIPEGVAVGVSFVDLGTEASVEVAGVALPALAVFMAIAISILNVPEGLAIAIPLIAYGMDRWKVVGWAVFSGLPQPIGAVGAYLFVTAVEGLLALSFGFAAGALLYLVVVEFLPAGTAAGEALENRGRPELLAGALVGFAATLAVIAAVEGIGAV